MENQEFIQQQPHYESVAMQSDEVRAEFIKKTYFHLALAVLVFMLVEAVFLNVPAIVNIGLSMTQGWTWLLVLMGFGFATNYAERMAMNTTSRSQQYLAFGLYIIAEAFIFVPIIYIGIYLTGDFALVNKAAMLTLSLFAGLSAVVFLTGKDFSFLRTAITVGSVVAIGLIVVGIIFGFNLGLWFSFAMVGLAAAAILYQTSNMLHHYHTEQYVAASLGLFGSLMLLFWYILRIFQSE